MNIQKTMDELERLREERKREIYKTTETEEEYIEQMDDKEALVYKIATEHLGSSFDVSKCIGYKKFLSNVKK